MYGLNASPAKWMQDVANVQAAISGPLRPPPTGQYWILQGRKWQRMVLLVINRKYWATWGHVRRSVLKMPKNLYGPATGMGKHLGRWGFREISSEW